MWTNQSMLNDQMSGYYGNSLDYQNNLVNSTNNNLISGGSLYANHPSITKQSISGNNIHSSNMDEDSNNKKKRRGQQRNSRKVAIEKRRRDRINSSLNELRRLVPAAFEKQGSSKLEKAEILQLTVDHLRNLHAKGFDTFTFDPHSFAMNYHAVGFQECITEVARYFSTFERLELEDPLKHRIISHLRCYLAQRELSLKSAAGAHSTWNPSLFHTPQHFSPHSLGSDSSSSGSAASLNSVSSSNNNNNNNSASQNQHNNNNSGNGTAVSQSSTGTNSNNSSSAVTVNSNSNNQSNNGSSSALSATSGSPNSSLQFSLAVKMSSSPSPASPASPASHSQSVHATSPLDAQVYAHALQRHAGNELLSAMMPPPPPPPALLHKVQTSLTGGSCTGTVGELSTYTNMHCAYPTPQMAATSVSPGAMNNDLNHMHQNLTTSGAGIPNSHATAVSYASNAVATQAYAAAAAAAQHSPYFGSSLAYGSNPVAAAAAAANANAAAQQQSAKYCRPWGAELAY